MPTPSNYTDIPVKKLKINFHIIQTEDVTTPGNFENITADINFLESLVYSSDGINDRYRNLDPSTRPRTCDCGTDCYIPDSRIEFELKGIYFHQNDMEYINIANTAYYNLVNVNADEEINIFFHGDSGGALGGGTINLGGPIDNNGTPDFQFLNGRIYIYLRNYYPVYTANPLWASKQAMVTNLVHELSHAMGLLHTYFPTCCREPGTTTSLDFLTDVFGNGNVGCPNDAWHQYEGEDCTIAPLDLGSCTNNIMGTSWHVARYLSPKQLGRIHRNTYLNRLRNYIDGCPYTTVPWVVSSNETWDFDIRMYEDIVVKPGASLTLTCAVRMPKDGKIIVERGAKLIVDGATITNACDGERWNGIEVWGNTAVLHADLWGGTTSPANLTLADYENVVLNTSDPGMIILKNDAVIENGPNGTIRAFRPSFTAHSGGIVYAENATFTNNRRGVAFMAYPHVNYSQFRNCEFLSNDPSTMFVGVSMWDNNGIGFDNCDFIFSGDVSIADDYRIGVIVLDANTTIINGCYFEGLKHGVDVASTMALVSKVAIGIANVPTTGNTFFNNETSIYANAPDNLEIHNNLIQSSRTNDFGIYISGVSDFRIKDNTFDNLNTAAFLHNTNRGNNEIICNLFSKPDIGIYAVANNIGTTFYDNTFDGATRYDVFVLSIGSEAGQIADQGLGAAPTYNLFSMSSPTFVERIRTAALFGAVPTLDFRYWHPDEMIEERLVPRCAINTPTGCAYVNNFYAYPVITSGIYTGCLPLDTDGDGMLALSEDCNTRACLDAKRLQIQQLKDNIDGGDTEGMTADLAAFPNGEATYQSLKDASPYLSDEVLLQIAQSTLMAEWKRADLLMSNSPLSEAVITAAESNISAYVYDILYAVYYYETLSARDALEAQIAKEERQKEDILRYLIKEYSKVQNYAEVQEILEEEGTTYASRALLALHNQQGNFVTAQSLLDTLPTTTEAEQQFKTLQSINIARLSDPAFVLSAEQEASLYQIADSYTDQRATAQAILSVVKGEVFSPPVFDLNNTSGKSTKQRLKPRLNTADLNTLLISPNPVNSTANFYIPQAVPANTYLQVFDISGHLVEKLPLRQGQIVGSFDVYNWQNGIYLMGVYNGNTALVPPSKLLVNH